MLIIYFVYSRIFIDVWVIILIIFGEIKIDKWYRCIIIWLKKKTALYIVCNRAINIKFWMDVISNF